MYAVIDVGGTKTLLAIFSNEGEIVEQIKFPTPDKYSDFQKELADNVDKLSTKDFQAVGVAIPGKVDRKNGVGLIFGNLGWQNVPIQSTVEKIFNAPAVIENDANLAALSEARLLMPDYSKVLYVTISTGIGSGLVIDGDLAPQFLDAEAGHILLEHSGSLQRWEEFASGKAIVAKFGKRAGDIDKDDQEAWYVISRNIAIGLIDLIATYTPDAVVIGGGVGSHFDKFIGRLEEQLKIYDHPMVSIPPILKAKHPEEAVIYGCYEFVKDKYGSNS